MSSLYYKYEVLFLKSCAKFDMMNKDIDTNSIYVTGFTKTIPIGTRNEIQFVADY